MAEKEFGGWNRQNEQCGGPAGKIHLRCKEKDKKKTGRVMKEHIAKKKGKRKKQIRKMTNSREGKQEQSRWDQGAELNREH